MRAGVVEGDLVAVEAYKSSGGDIARQLTSDEVRLLGRPSAFDVGFTLVHLSIRFQRQDMLTLLLTEVQLTDDFTRVNVEMRLLCSTGDVFACGRRCRSRRRNASLRWLVLN